VVVELDEDVLPKDQQLEPSEKIEVCRVKKDQIRDFFQKAAVKGDIIAGGLWYMLMAKQYL
jgi:hypothetical protein